MTENELQGIRLFEKFGNAGKKMPHVEVWVGMVDIRYIKSIEEAQRKKTNDGTVNDMEKDFDRSQFKTPTICIMPDNSLHNADGKHRIVVYRQLYRDGEIKSPWIPCNILFNTTERDIKILFADQDENKTRVPYTEKVDKLKDVEERSCSKIDTIFVESGIPKGIKQTNAQKTIVDCYDDIGNALFIRMTNCISKGWENGRTKDAMKQDIIKVLWWGYKNYSEQINDYILIKQMKSLSPEELMEEIENWTRVAKKKRNREEIIYLNSFLEFYNGDRKRDIISRFV